MLAVLAGIYFRLSADEWRWIILAIALVWLAEAFNTAIERLGDAITHEHNDYLKFAKDVAAGAVLVASITSALIGLTVFIPHIFG